MIHGLPLSKYLSFILFGNQACLNIFNAFVDAPMIPVLGFLVVYFLIDLYIYSIAVKIFCGRLIDGGFVTGTVPGFMLPYTEVGNDVGNGSSDMSSNNSHLNEGLK